MTTITITDSLRSSTPTVLTVALQGPPGTSGDLLPFRILKPAGAALSGHRIVRLNADGEAVYADHTVVADASAVLGMTIAAASQGDDVLVQTEGELVEPSWSWGPDLPIFLGAEGQLTQSPPATGFILCIAVPTGADRAVIRIGEPFLL